MTFHLEFPDEMFIERPAPSDEQDIADEMGANLAEVIQDEMQEGMAWEGVPYSDKLTVEYVEGGPA